MERAARRIVEKLRRGGHQAFFAGGWVRDHLLGRAADDIDIATGARPADVQALFPHSIAVGASFGVVRVRAYGRSFDVATFRTEGPYLDGRHPSSVTFAGPRQDALRRDFTVNGLFYDPLADKLIDYVAGRADLRRRVLRAIGEPRKRFREDRLRMMRAVRLACKLGFKIEPSTWRAIRWMAEAITTVSSERIRDELLKLLTGPDRPRGLALLRGSGLLEAFMPEAQALFGAAAQEASEIFFSTARALALLRRPSTELALATLLHPAGPDAALGISRRLRLSAASAARVGELVKRQPEFDRARAMRESALKRLLGRKDAREHLELLRARSLAEGRALDEYDFCRRTWKEMQREPGAGPLLTGGDLIGMGYTPGPLFRKILDAVEDLRLERTLRTKREAVEHVRRAYPKGPAAPSEDVQ